MFDFQKLNVYTKARDFNIELRKVVEEHDLEEYSSERITKSAYKIMLDIARGTAPRNPRDRSICFTDARVSVHECAAILDYLLYCKQFEQGIYDQLIEPMDALSKMLFVLARKTAEMPEKRDKVTELAES